MERRIRISAGPVEAYACLNSTRTAIAIWEALPISAAVNIWGEEIYFPIPVDMKAEEPKEVVTLGDIAYWPPGKAFCIFFGSTPVSRGGEIRPASAVNVVGKVEGNAKVFKKVNEGTKIRLERA